MLTLEFDKFYLVAVYVPNAGVDLKRVEYRTQEWDVDFFAYLKSLDETGKAVVLGGDLNVVHKDIDIHDTTDKEKLAGFSPQERKSFDDFLQSTSFVDTYRHFNPTIQKFSFWNLKFGNRGNNKGWRLDYFLVNEAGMPGVQDSLIHN